jgi:sulfide:quinone oxidoreductase
VPSCPQRPPGDAVTEFDPAQNQIVLRSGDRVGYDYLIVAPGIKLNWDQIKGLSEAELGRNGICSNYLYEECEGTWRTLQEFQGGTAIFTMPPPPIKCAGAPQKIIYTAATPGIFAVKEFAKTLKPGDRPQGDRDPLQAHLVEICPEQRQAVFQDAEHEDEVVLDYDTIHLAPPQGPPDVVKESPLADEAGWVDVDKYTLQHTRFPNVFSLGDASSLPTSKTGAAIRKEAPVLVHNLLATMRGDAPASFKRYDGYSSCPIPTGYGKLVLAEFDYDLKPAPSFPFDTTKERHSMYQLKRYGLPALYWRGMLKGRA